MWYSRPERAKFPSRTGGFGAACAHGWLHQHARSPAQRPAKKKKKKRSAAIVTRISCAPRSLPRRDPRLPLRARGRINGAVDLLVAQDRLHVFARLRERNRLHKLVHPADTVPPPASPPPASRPRCTPPARTPPRRQTGPASAASSAFPAGCWSPGPATETSGSGSCPLRAPAACPPSAAICISPHAFA